MKLFRWTTSLKRNRKQLWLVWTKGISRWFRNV